MKENNYDFRKRLLEVHKTNRRDYGIKPLPSEVMIDDGWLILLNERAERVLVNAAKDLAEFLLVSMGVSVSIKKCPDIRTEAANDKSRIILTTREELEEFGGALDTPRSYRLQCNSKGIIICGYDERGTAQGCYYLEDLMNLVSAPILKESDISRKPLFSPRMVHSGYGLDMFPDAHLNAIAHAGMDAILVFAKDADLTPHGYMDFNELIYRAQGYGLDVYAYSYLKSMKHPDDSDAEDYYDSTYGRLFEKCPGFKGIVMVGESVEFPSKDPRASGKFYYENTIDGLPTGKPSPGWWPCYDYPKWLEMIKKVVKKNSPKADIVFWTYNWGYVEAEHRIELLRNIPTDITLLVTFEMFEKLKTENVTSTCVDYTLSFEGPGQYFISEAEIAKERGIKLYTMCNTGGLTWDIGVIPYEPTPNQWIKRHDALLTAREKWALSGLMESHHYGWWPSFISEIAKWAYWSPSPSSDEVCRKIAARDFGSENVESVIKAWSAWSLGIKHYVSTNEDQYGPFRIGPAYPLVLMRNVKIPSVPHAMFGGNEICNTLYGPYDAGRCSLFQFRLPVELRSLQKMADYFSDGVVSFEEVYDKLPEAKKKDAFYLINMGKFIVNCVKTTIHVKQWYMLKCKLLTETDEDKLCETIYEMTRIGKAEIRNAEETIPLVEADSRLGWEPSMEYMTDAYHLKWKIRQVEMVLENELPMYKSSLRFNSVDSNP